MIEGFSRCSSRSELSSEDMRIRSRGERQIQSFALREQKKERLFPENLTQTLENEKVGKPGRNQPNQMRKGSVETTMKTKRCPTDS
jgi:hypothetical protein